jgi:hypothetical protein
MNAVMGVHAESISPQGKDGEPNHGEASGESCRAGTCLRRIGNADDRRDGSEAAVGKTVRRQWRQLHDAPCLNRCLLAIVQTTVRPKLEHQFGRSRHHSVMHSMR